MPDTLDERPAPGGPADIKPVSILDEMKRSYLDYAMSVIVSRALARRPRRPQARASAHPLRDARAQFHARPPLQQVRAHRRRRDGQIPSARRSRDLRRAGAHGAGLLDARAAHRRPGQFRLGRRRSAGGACATPKRGSQPRRDGAARGSRQGHRRFPARTTTRRSWSRSSCRRAFPTCSSTAPAASPSAWRPTSRRTISARRSTACSR